MGQRAEQGRVFELQLGEIGQNAERQRRAVVVKKEIRRIEEESRLPGVACALFEIDGVGVFRTGPLQALDPTDQPTLPAQKGDGGRP